MKTCSQIASEINKLRVSWKQKRFVDCYFELTEQEKCDADSECIKCEKCNCWKSHLEDKKGMVIK
jgi:hypothetical protein